MTSTEDNKSTNLEQAAERVRIAALEIRVAADLCRVAAVVFREMVDLGVATPFVTVFVVDEAVDEVHNYYGAPHTLATEENRAVAEAVFGGTYAGVSPRGKVADWLQESVMTVNGEKSVAEVIRWGSGETATYRCSTKEGPFSVTNVPFRSGLIGYREKQHHPEHAKEHERIVKELARGLDLGFVRFQDFQRLERQNRELEIERSLERLRTGVAAMESGDSLESLKDQVLEELQAFGVPCQQVSIQTVSPEQGDLVFDRGTRVSPEAQTVVPMFVE
jgi:hypothetical protein